jgi:hypothetical protein
VRSGLEHRPEVALHWFYDLGAAGPAAHEVGLIAPAFLNLNRAPGPHGGRGRVSGATSPPQAPTTACQPASREKRFTVTEAFHLPEVTPGKGGVPGPVCFRV